MCNGYFHRSYNCNALSPSFDPNAFVFGISQDDWQLIRNNPMKPLINKSIAGNYSPGPTIKPIVALSALENDIVSPKFTVQCKGHKNFGTLWTILPLLEKQSWICKYERSNNNLDTYFTR